MQEGYDKSKALGTGFLQYDGWLAEVLALAGKLDNAKKIVRTIQEKRKETAQTSADVTVYRALGIVAAQESPPDWKQVCEHMNRSLRLAGKRRERPNSAITHFRYAELLREQGDQNQARQQLTKAAALFRAMEMTWWLEQAEKLKERLPPPS